MSRTNSPTQTNSPPRTANRQSPTEDRNHSSNNKDRSVTLYLASLLRWFQLKKYQYEVTFSLYMLTGTEKFIFNLILFVLITLLVVAASMYLPDHVLIIYRRIWYYVHGQGESAGVDIGELGHAVRDRVVRGSGKVVMESIAAVRSGKGEL